MESLRRRGGRWVALHQIAADHGQDLDAGVGIERAILRDRARKHVVDHHRRYGGGETERGGEQRLGAGLDALVGRQMLRGTGILATIGATAPFVGLFGTVWGIMNSFIGISKLHTTNLAVVAPGIAEALLATAFGLAAAIPAVVIYNMFSRSIAQYLALYADTSVEILTMVSRDLVQRYPAAAPAAE